MDKGRSPRKTFTAEVQLRNRYGGDAPPGGGGGAVVAASDPEMRDEVSALKNEVSHLSHLLRTYVIPPEDEQKAADGEPDPEDPLVKEFERQRTEVRILKMELRALANSIQETKREIAQLRTSDGDSDRLDIVAGELDAVVGATERATDGILEAAEKIDNAAQNLRSKADDAYFAHLAEDISEHVVSIFEHANFQDITGQRINKVVSTLKFVEERIDKMINIWGQETFEELLAEIPDGPAGDDERRLLNGPQMAEKAISQGDIDKLFG